ncbi:hypothetical protein [Stutzerimonas kirkiae]|uniref:hypothetical protein n=1 Tax=Stutzerimonas kirkiae TaxID=2211392 RepID=UPI001037E0E7|nr:hypothetical protein [Stutzerimonas kirkiae]
MIREAIRLTPWMMNETPHEVLRAEEVATIEAGKRVCTLHAEVVFQGYPGTWPCAAKAQLFGNQQFAVRLNGVEHSAERPPVISCCK